MVFLWFSCDFWRISLSKHGHSPMANAGDAFAAAEAYAERCKRLAMPVEPSIAVWLRLGGGSLQATERPGAQREFCGFDELGWFD